MVLVRRIRDDGDEGQDVVEETSPASQRKDQFKGVEDGNGELELQPCLPQLPPAGDLVLEIHDEPIITRLGRLRRIEWRRDVKVRAFRFANRVILPRSQREISETDDGKHADLYSCIPPPVFMIAISLIEFGVFVYHTRDLVKEHGLRIGLSGPAPVDSIFIYNPFRRYQVWRFLTYMLVHSGYWHLVNNLLCQLMLGILLEMVHHWWRVLLVYFAGVCAGSIVTSVTDPSVFLAGASGGVYALITAHLANAIINWSEMEYPWFRVVFFGVFATMDIGTAIYYRYVEDISTHVGYAAHFAGAVAGLLVGLYTLKNIKLTKWEKVLWWVSLGVYLGLMAILILWNIFIPSWFLKQRYQL